MNFKRINDKVIIDIDEILSVETTIYKTPRVVVTFKKRKDCEYYDCSIDEIEKALKG